MRQANNARRSTYCVQGFHLQGGSIQAEPQTPARDEDHALRMGERLAQTRAGVVVLRQDHTSGADDINEPEVLAIHGRVPLIFHDIPF